VGVCIEKGTLAVFIGSGGECAIHRGKERVSHAKSAGDGHVDSALPMGSDGGDKDVGRSPAIRPANAFLGKTIFWSGTDMGAGAEHAWLF
jgi:hypothetical protein